MAQLPPVIGSSFLRRVQTRDNNGKCTTWEELSEYAHGRPESFFCRGRASRSVVNSIRMRIHASWYGTLARISASVRSVLLPVLNQTGPFFLEGCRCVYACGDAERVNVPTVDGPILRYVFPLPGPRRSQS